MDSNTNNGLNAEAQTVSPKYEDGKVLLQEGNNLIDGLDVNIDTTVNQFALGAITPATNQNINRNATANLQNDYEAQETIHSESNPLDDSKSGGLWDAPVLPTSYSHAKESSIPTIKKSSIASIKGPRP